MNEARDSLAQRRDATALGDSAKRPKSRGHRVKVLDTLKFSIDLAEGEPDLYFRSKPLSHYDAVLPRIGASITYYGTAVLRQFEQMDVFCANPSWGVANSRDKLRCLQILSKHRIGMPPTTFVRDRKDILPAIDRVGGAPVVIKLIEGTQGVGVILAESNKIAEAIIETLQSTKQNVLVQKFVAESKGSRPAGVRHRRPGRRGDAYASRVGNGVPEQRPPWRHHRAGRDRAKTACRGSPSAPPRSWACASRASTCSSRTKGPQVMEVNSSPGLEGIEQCTQLDIAGAIIDYIAARVDFPEVDIHQRLTVSRGYGVTEIHIPEGSDYVGKTIDESGLPDKDINVLTLYRDTSVIPNPRLKRTLRSRRPVALLR